jgi:hypothetical protein
LTKVKEPVEKVGAFGEPLNKVGGVGVGFESSWNNALPEGLEKLNKSGAALAEIEVKQAAQATLAISKYLSFMDSSPYEIAFANGQHWTQFVSPNSVT